MLCCQVTQPPVAVLACSCTMSFISEAHAILASQTRKPRFPSLSLGWFDDGGSPLVDKAGKETVFGIPHPVWYLCQARGAGSCSPCPVRWCSRSRSHLVCRAPLACNKYRTMRSASVTPHEHHHHHHLSPQSRVVLLFVVCFSSFSGVA